MYGCEGGPKEGAKKLMLLNCGSGEDYWESPLDSMEIKPVNSRGNQPWIFIERTDSEAEAPILWRSPFFFFFNLNLFILIGG